ncbi:DUF6427 family protein [Flavobacteriaceae sp. LMIT009]
MIARFFNTSKPIHSVLIAVFLLFVFFALRVEVIFNDFKLNQLFNETLKFLIVIGSVFVLDFLVQKNKLTKKNGYEILIFSLLMVTFPKTLLKTNIFVANFFILLALRRIISLRSNLRVKKKLFDAAFWICIAALFHFWSIMFLVLIVAAIFLHSITNVKNWIIPIIGAGTVVLLVITYSIIIENGFGNLNDYIEGFGSDFSHYKSNNLLLVLVILSLLSLWSIGYYIVHLGNKPKSFQPSFILVLIAFILGLGIVLITPNKNSSELIFTFPALTIIISNYFESIKNKWLSEGLVLLMLVLPVLNLVL